MRPELFFPALFMFGGIGSILKGDVRVGVVALVGTVCLQVGLMVFPGPLRATPESAGIALVAAAFLVFAWVPLWESWVGDGLLAPFLTGFTATVGAEIIGRWNDRTMGSRVIASEVQERIANSYPVNIPALFLHCHYGRWFGVAETTLPIPLYLKDGSTKFLLPGDRHFWIIGSDRAPDMAEMSTPQEIYTFPERSG